VCPYIWVTETYEHNLSMDKLNTTRRLKQSRRRCISSNIVRHVYETWVQHNNIHIDS